MRRNCKKIVEFRFYEKPVTEPVLVMMGEDWIKNFGERISCYHFHNLMEIGYCVWGKGRITLNKNVCNYQNGTFTLIPHNILHGTDSEGDCYWEYLFFDVEQIIEERYKGEPEKAKKIMDCITRNGKIYQEAKEPYLCNLIRTVFELMKQKKRYYKETIQGILFAIAMQLAAENEENETKISESINSIAPALIHVAHYYDKEILIRDLAKCCHLSEPHFRRVFHENMNMTPIEYINLVRVQAACDLMRKGNEHMDIVAQKVGYQTVSTFNRNFHKIIGLSPYQWKKKMDKEVEKVGEYRISAKRGW